MVPYFTEGHFIRLLYLYLYHERFNQKSDPRGIRSGT